MRNLPKMLPLPLIPPDQTLFKRRLSALGHTSRRGFENLLEDSFFLGGRFLGTIASVKEPAYTSLTRLESRVRGLARQREQTAAFLAGSVVLILLLI